jgi:hypothetical protein
MRKCFFSLLAALSIICECRGGSGRARQRCRLRRDRRGPGTRPRRGKKRGGFATTVTPAGSYTGADAGTGAGTERTGQGSSAIINEGIAWPSIAEVIYAVVIADDTGAARIHSLRPSSEFKRGAGNRSSRRARTPSCAIPCTVERSCSC